MEHEKEESFVKVTLIYKPEDRELMLFKRCIWVTMAKRKSPKPPRAHSSFAASFTHDTAPSAS